MNGCAVKCCINVHKVNALDILSYHSYFEQLSREARQKWLIQYFNNQSSKNGLGEVEINYYICGKEVCQPVWISTLGISVSTFYNARKKFLSGSLVVVHDTQRSPRLRTNQAIAWMKNYFDLIGDKLPHRMSVHLPSNLSKLAIYQRMTADFQKRRENIIISQSNFFRIWDENFPEVVIPKVRVFARECIMTLNYACLEI